MSSSRNPPAVVSGLYGHGLDNISQRAQPEYAWNTPSLPAGSHAAIRPPLAYSDKLFGSNRQQGRDAETISVTVVGTETVGDVPCLMKKLPMFYLARRYRQNEGKYPQMLMMNVLCVNKLLSGEDKLRSNAILHKDEFERVRRSKKAADVLHAFRFYGFLKTATPSLNTSGSMAAQEGTFALRGDEEAFNLWVGCDPEGIAQSHTPQGSRPHVFVAMRLQKVNRSTSLAEQKLARPSAEEEKPDQNSAMIIVSREGVSTNYSRPSSEHKESVDDEQAGDEGEEEEEIPDEKEEKKERALSSEVAESQSTKIKRHRRREDDDDEGIGELPAGVCWAFVPVAAYSLAELTEYDSEDVVTIPIGMISEWYSGRQKFPQAFMTKILQLPKWHAEDDADIHANAQDEYAHTSASGLSQLPRVKISLSPITQISRFVYREKEGEVYEFKLTDAFE